jgi:hypothetical protein
VVTAFVNDLDRRPKISHLVIAHRSAVRVKAQDEPIRLAPAVSVSTPRPSNPMSLASRAVSADPVRAGPSRARTRTAR